ncbi:MAG: bifunctional metallophosphatase/5'-nucleotidase [Phycisphaeraceae bacterium]
MRFVNKSAFSTLALIGAMAASPAYADYSITVLHNNDGESAIDNISSFATMLQDTRSYYSGQGHGVLSIYAGDSFLAGPEFQASIDTNPGNPLARTYYDARAISQIGYDAAIIGNHEFDAGPDTLAGFIGEAQTFGSVDFLSANLDFTGEANLNALVGTNLFKSQTYTVSTSDGNKTVGVIGATTTSLPFISSPGNVVVNPLAAAINTEIANLAGADHIILASHLQGLSADQNLVASLDPGIDLIIAGGGGEFLASPGAPSPSTVYTTGPGTVPPSISDTSPGASPDGPYPTISAATDGGGNNIPIVTTEGDYDWLGRITLNVDSLGNITLDNTSNVQENTGYADDPTVASIVAPVETFTAALAATQVVTNSGNLVGNEDRDIIRAEEAPLGNLIADAILAKAQDVAASNGVDTATVAVMNGGGIRSSFLANGESVGSKGPDDGIVSRLETFDVLPFGNSMAIIEDVTSEDFLQVLEVAVSKVFDGKPGSGIDPDQNGVSDTGRFLHFAGGSLVYDIEEQGMVLDDNGNIVTQGERVVSFILDDGTVLIEDGEAVAGLTIDVAGLSFTLGGGDQLFDEAYTSIAYTPTLLSDTAGLVGDQRLLEEYLEALSGGDTSFDLSSDFRYDNVADGRIVVIPEPGSLALLGLGGLLVARRRRG